MRNQDIDEALRSLAPVEDAALIGADRLPVATELRHAIATSSISVASRPTAKTQVMRRRRRTVLLVAALSIASTVAVSASIDWSGRTFSDGQLTSSQVVEFIVSIEGDVPLPPGGSFEALKENVASVDALQDEAGAAGMVAFNASCQWMAAWVEASGAGSQESAAGALEGLTEVTTWKPLLDVDGGGVVSHINGALAAARDGDSQAVVEYLDTNCGPEAGWR